MKKTVTLGAGAFLASVGGAAGGAKGDPGVELLQGVLDPKVYYQFLPAGCEAVEAGKPREFPVYDATGKNIVGTVKVPKMELRGSTCPGAAPKVQ